MSKLKAQLRPISRTMSWVRWSSRVGSIEDAARRKSIAYIGFPDKLAATKFYDHVVKRRPEWKWKAYPKVEGQDNDGQGMTKPRRSERLTEHPYEIKWHYPPLEFIEGLIRWDNGDDVTGHRLVEQAYATK